MDSEVLQNEPCIIEVRKDGKYRDCSKLDDSSKQSSEDSVNALTSSSSGSQNIGSSQSNSANNIQSSSSNIEENSPAAEISKEEATTSGTSIESVEPSTANPTSIGQSG